MNLYSPSVDMFESVSPALALDFGLSNLALFWFVSREDPTGLFKTQSSFSSISLTGLDGEKLGVVSGTCLFFL